MINVYFHVINKDTLSIFSNLRDLRHINIKLWFQRDDVQNRKDIIHVKDIDIIEHNCIDNSIGCFNWDIEEEKVMHLFKGLNHLVSRCVLYGSSFVCIDDKKHCGNQLIFFQDAKHKAEYPKEFIKIPCYNNWEDFYNYLLNKNIFSFSLEDETKFVKCANINPVQGAIVYKEKDTGHYWYLDNFHKTHFEVFDATGKRHIGEADLEGNIDYGKADKRKSPIK